MLALAALLSTLSAFAALDPAVDKPEDRRGIKWGGYPVINYSTDEQLILGAFGTRLDYGDQGLRPYESRLSLALRHAQQGRRFAFISFQKVGVASERDRLTFFLFGGTNASQRYYGLGSQSAFDPNLLDSGFYFHTQNEFSAQALYRRALPDSSWEWESGLDWTYYLLKPNDGSTLFRNDFGSGTESFHATHIVLRILREARDNELIPFEGWYASARLEFAPSFMTTWRSTYARGDIDARKYWPLIPDRWLGLAAQVRYEGSSVDTPLPQKATLGSSDTVRGLALNRFRSNHVLSARAELRSIWVRMRIFDLPLKAGTGIFVDGGQVGENFGRLFETSTRLSAGFSLFGSYFTDDFMGRADVGFSAEGYNLYLLVGYAF